MAHRKKYAAAGGHRTNPTPRRRNADGTGRAARLYEKFHGRKPRRVKEVTELEDRPDTLAELGSLIELQVFVAENQLATLKGFSGVKVASNGEGSQIYFVGGDQALKLQDFGLAKVPKDHVAIGDVWQIVYRTTKAFHDFEPTDYVHEFGEDGGWLPILGYDVRNRRLYLVGGSYTVKPEGITN